MPDTSQERTEDATPKRRLEARRKGTVTKSTDLNNALVLLALILVLPFGISKIGAGFMTAVNTAFTKMPTELRMDTIVPYVGVVIQPALIGLAVIVGATMMVGVAANFAQVGFVLSAEALTPNLNKLNPASGLKRLFSMSATFEGFKAAAKAGIFMYLAWTAIQSGWPQIVRLGEMTPIQSLSAIGLIIRAIAMRIAFVWLALAALDYFFQRKQVDKQLRMTKEELKQEMKEQETSPELKMAQAARRRKLSRGRMMEAIKSADVVVTNPTHYAVAIKYEPGKSHAPIVVAKGADFLAAKI
ncbi:MAG TPA: EscU/YscU/HrcU family type III secretion system export apparatus switch protein, partial [Fimbriimonadaceae bacterium]|nr:EscU/YscU/HrcU family type III secretion system export apparatus switch protein [Fimbriimonadaceae bacterium]